MAAMVALAPYPRSYPRQLPSVGRMWALSSGASVRRTKAPRPASPQAALGVIGARGAAANNFRHSAEFT